MEEVDANVGEHGLFLSVLWGDVAWGKEKITK